MKHVAKGVALIALLAASACTNPSTNRPLDTGSMSTPTPYRAGIVDPTTQSRDVGSMSTPSTRGGVVVREPTQLDTGSMALPSQEIRPSTPSRMSP